METWRRTKRPYLRPKWPTLRRNDPDRNYPWRVRKGRNHLIRSTDWVVNGSRCSQSELLAYLPIVTASNSLPQCSIQDVVHAQSRYNNQHKCHRSWIWELYVENYLIYCVRTKVLTKVQFVTLTFDLLTPKCICIFILPSCIYVWNDACWKLLMLSCLSKALTNTQTNLFLKVTREALIITWSHLSTEYRTCCRQKLINKRPKGPHIVHLSKMCHLFDRLAKAAILFFRSAQKHILGRWRWDLSSCKVSLQARSGVSEEKSKIVSANQRPGRPYCFFRWARKTQTW